MTAHSDHADPRHPATSAGSGRRVGGLRPVLLVVAWLVPVGVLLQAALAGQALFVSPGLFGLHGGIGHGVLVLAVVTAGLALLAASRPAAVLAGLAVVALIAQTGLGYVGHRGGVPLASSLHIPLGVAILGLTVAAAVLLTLSGTRAGAVRDDGENADVRADA